jgi:hypothetical protein
VHERSRGESLASPRHPGALCGMLRHALCASSCPMGRALPQGTRPIQLAPCGPLPANCPHLSKDDRQMHWRSGAVLAAVVHRSPSARVGDLWRSRGLGATHQTALGGTSLQPGALSGAHWLAFRSAAMVIGRQRHAGDLWRSLAISDAVTLHCLEEGPDGTQTALSSCTHPSTTAITKAQP